MSFRLGEERITEDQHLAVHLLREEIEVDGELVSVMLTTNIYHRTNGSWRMMLHHSSPEPEPMIDEYDIVPDEQLVLH